MLVLRHLAAHWSTHTHTHGHSNSQLSHSHMHHTNTHTYTHAHTYLLTYLLRNSTSEVSSHQNKRFTVECLLRPGYHEQSVGRCFIRRGDVVGGDPAAIHQRNHRHSFLEGLRWPLLIKSHSYGPTVVLLIFYRSFLRRSKGLGLHSRCNTRVVTLVEDVRSRALRGAALHALPGEPGCFLKQLSLSCHLGVYST